MSRLPTRLARRSAFGFRDLLMAPQLGVVARPVRPQAPSERRSIEQLREQYLVERELADRVRQATPEERGHLYAEAYNELFSRIPHHPMLAEKSEPTRATSRHKSQIAFIMSFIRPDSTFLEIGAGDCAVSLEIAKRARTVYAVDVSEVITGNVQRPDNFTLMITDGRSLPLSAGSVDVVLSDQLMEHLHPDDGYDQLKEIVGLLKPNGAYTCFTPNRLNGPHDISKYFDTAATGFHMKEYTSGELAGLFKRAGFRRVTPYAVVSGRYIKLPLALVTLAERFLSLLPSQPGRKLADLAPFRKLLGIRLVGVK
jgi:SAM-dependent methyltransferase